MFEAVGNVKTWAKAQAAYRQILFCKAEQAPDGSGRKGIASKKVDAVKQREGALSWVEVLQCRVRYFTDGLAIGSEGFVDRVFRNQRDRMKVRREAGARIPRGEMLGDLRTLVDLRGEVT